jgi:hypothetical protein
MVKCTHVGQQAYDIGVVRADEANSKQNDKL